MAQLNVDLSVPTSPLVARIARALEIPRAHAAGCLLLLWTQLAFRDCEGRLEIDDAMLEEWAGWTGEAGAFAKAAKTHALDAQGVCVGWEEMYGHYDTDRANAARRKREERERKRAAAEAAARAQAAEQDVTRGHSDGRDSHTLPALPLPALTVPKNGKGRSSSSGARGSSEPPPGAANVSIPEKLREAIAPLLLESF